MNRHESLVAELLAERFGPLPVVLPERVPDVAHRRRVLAEAMAPKDMAGWMPPPARIEIGNDVAALAGRGWSAEQIAALLRVDVARVRRLLGVRIPPGVGNPTLRGAA